MIRTYFISFHFDSNKGSGVGNGYFETSGKLNTKGKIDSITEELKAEGKYINVVVTNLVQIKTSWLREGTI